MNVETKALLCLLIRIMKFHVSFSPKGVKSKTYKMIEKELKTLYPEGYLKQFQEENKEYLLIEENNEDIK